MKLSCDECGTLHELIIHLSAIVRIPCNNLGNRYGHLVKPPCKYKCWATFDEYNWDPGIHNAGLLTLPTDGHCDWAISQCDLFVWYVWLNRGANRQIEEGGGAFTNEWQQHWSCARLCILLNLKSASVCHAIPLFASTHRGCATPSNVDRHWGRWLIPRGSIGLIVDIKYQPTSASADRKWRDSFAFYFL